MFHFTSHVNLTLIKQKSYSQLKVYTEEIQQKLASNQFNFPEASLQLPLKPDILPFIEKQLNHIDLTKLKYIFLVGIGGSNLGTKAVYSALWKVGKYKTIIFLDTINQQQSEVIDHIIENDISNEEDFCVVTISKSGTTYETIFLHEVLQQKIEKKFNDSLHNRFIVISDINSPLTSTAKTNKNPSFTIPEYVGGRFSVLSTVGLVPLFLAGFNCSELLRGGRDFVNHVLEDGLTNASADQAVELFHAYENGAVIHNLFLFSPALEQLGAWYRQLLSESVGKKYSTSGQEVNQGIYPIVSVGSTDLHSQAQLFFNGNTKQVFTTFITTVITPKDVSLITSTSDQKLISTIYTGVVNAYKNNKLNYNEIALDKIDEFHIGLYLVQAELMIMYLAKLLTVNAFDQPEVELYKNEVRTLI